MEEASPEGLIRAFPNRSKSTIAHNKSAGGEKFRRASPAT